MKKITFDLRDGSLAEIILYSVIGFMAYFLYQNSKLWGSVLIFYLIFEITIRRFEIKIRNLKAKRGEDGR